MSELLFITLHTLHLSEVAPRNLLMQLLVIYTLVTHWDYNIREKLKPITLFLLLKRFKIF